MIAISKYSVNELSPFKRQGTTGFFAMIGSGNRPIINILHKKHGGQPQAGGWIREDSNSPCTPPYIFVEPLQHVCGGDLSDVQLWKCIEGKGIFQPVL